MPSIAVVIAAANELAYQILDKAAVAIGEVVWAIEAADTRAFACG